MRAIIFALLLSSCAAEPVYSQYQSLEKVRDGIWNNVKTIKVRKDTHVPVPRRKPKKESTR